MRAVAFVVSVWMLVGAVVAADDFWDEKEFTAWSDREVEKILTDSPWAKRVRVPVGGPQGGTGFGGGTAGMGLPGAGGGNTRGRGDGFGQGPQRLSLIVTWRSALPVKQAFVRTQIEQNGALRPVDERFLDQRESAYVVAVTGFPEAFEDLSDNLRAVAAAAWLELDRPDPIVAESAEVFREGDTITIVWFFPRSVPITLDDDEVELVAELGPIEFKRSFDLEDMLFGGVLVL